MSGVLFLAIGLHPVLKTTDVRCVCKTGRESWKRRTFTPEFKLEAVRLIRDRGFRYAQASQDLKVPPTQLRNWVKAFADHRQHAFPGQGQMKPEQKKPESTVKFQFIAKHRGI